MDQRIHSRRMLRGDGDSRSATSRIFPYQADEKWASKIHGQGVPLPLLEQGKWANSWLIQKFVEWLKGGEPMETNVSDNLQSVALIFAAIESARTGQPVAVQE